MAYDEELAERMREQMSGQAGLTEKRMFGGLAFLIDGRMAAAAGSQGSMLLRVHPDDTERLVADEHATRSRMQGREMDGWLAIDLLGLQTDEDLERWMAHGITYARSLPPRR
ncbi:TfoX/Sxy family transcriptional regulator of competence genes [Nakamurella sp. UYEF19]|uniref:TfoX/Sxy family protein n=1 Tax=Nakamurella sp. UYEF19 TaxID=1756392 RepID=UPI0033930455